MKVGVISDSHGGMIGVEYALRIAGRVDAWIHLGDFWSDSRWLAAAGVPVYYVRGNCDIASDAEWERVIELGGAKIFATHGHMYQAGQNPYKVVLRARELGCNVALYGHTHRPELSNEGDVLLVNPGSTSRPAIGSDTSIAVLTIYDGQVDAQIILI